MNFREYNQSRSGVGAAPNQQVPQAVGQDGAMIVAPPGAQTADVAPPGSAPQPTSKKAILWIAGAAAAGALVTWLAMRRKRRD